MFIIINIIVTIIFLQSVLQSTSDTNDSQVVTFGMLVLPLSLHGEFIQI